MPLEINEKVLRVLDERRWIEFRLWERVDPHPRPFEDPDPEQFVVRPNGYCGWFSPRHQPNRAGDMETVLYKHGDDQELSPEIRISEQGKAALAELDIARTTPTTNLENGGDEGNKKVKHPKADKTNKQSWTQNDVNQEIRKYKAERADAYGNYVKAIERQKENKKKQIIAQARKLFGRNVIAQHLGCHLAMVSNSQSWKAIRDELHLGKKKQVLGRGNRIGLDIADEKAAESAEKTRLTEDKKLELEQQLVDKKPEDLESAASELLGEEP